MSNRCPVCNKFAYAAESISVNGTYYHKTCMKCKTCKCNLSVSTYKLLKGTTEIYCSLHLPQPKNLQAAVTMETMNAAKRQPELHNRNILGGSEQRTNTGAMSVAERSAVQQQKASSTLHNRNVLGCSEQRSNTGAMSMSDRSAVQNHKLASSLHNGNVLGGADQRKNTGAMSVAERNAVQQQKQSSSLHNSQIRGAGRNTQAVDTIENQGSLNAPKVGTIMNPQIRGGWN